VRIAVVSKKKLKTWNITIIASIICGALVCWMILAVWKNCHCDFEREEEEARDAYYDKIIKK